MRTIKNDVYTYDTEKGTTIASNTLDLFTFDELSDDAKNRVVSDWADDNANSPYFFDYFSETVEREVWECVHELEAAITCADVEWSYNRWYSCDFDCEYKIKDIDWIAPDIAETVHDNGYCYSMDLCDAWNAHTRTLSALAGLYNHVCELKVDNYPAYEWENDGDAHNLAFYNRLEDMAGELLDRWIVELERACEDVRNAIEILLRGEWEYYTSEEYAREECSDESTQGYACYTSEYPYFSNGGYRGRVYYTDCRKWYTESGEFFEESNIIHECVSIVKAN